MSGKCEWYVLDAEWDVYGEASIKFMRLGETNEWVELVDEACSSTHATAGEVWDGMAAAIGGYLEALR